MQALSELVAGSPVANLVAKMARDIPSSVGPLHAIFAKLVKTKYKFGTQSTTSKAPANQVATAPTFRQNDTVVTFENLSCTLPRGRYSVALNFDGSVGFFKKAATAPTFVLTPSQLRHIIHVPKVDRQKQITAYIWCLVLQPSHNIAALKKGFVVFKVDLSGADRKKYGGWPDVEKQIKTDNLPQELLDRSTALTQSTHKDKKHVLINRFLKALLSDTPFTATSSKAFKTIGEQFSMMCYYKVRVRLRMIQAAYVVPQLIIGLPL